MRRMIKETKPLNQSQFATITLIGKVSESNVIYEIDNEIIPENDTYYKIQIKDPQIGNNPEIDLVFDKPLIPGVNAALIAGQNGTFFNFTGLRVYLDDGFITTFPDGSNDAQYQLVQEGPNSVQVVNETAIVLKNLGFAYLIDRSADY